MSRAVDPALTEHHRRSIQEWLDRELPGHTVTAGRNSFRIGPKYRLGFDPDTARWQLYVHNRRHEPNKACLSLTDWLNRLRQIVTKPAKRASFDTPRGL